MVNLRWSTWGGQLGVVNLVAKTKSASSCSRALCFLLGVALVGAQVGPILMEKGK